MNKANEWYVYIIECQNDKYYTGITKDIKKRFLAHKEGRGAAFTKINPVKKVIYTENCAKMSDALKREYEIKKMSRKEKEILVNEHRA